MSYQVEVTSDKKGNTVYQTVNTDDQTTVENPSISAKSTDQADLMQILSSLEETLNNSSDEDSPFNSFKKASPVLAQTVENLKNDKTLLENTLQKAIQDLQTATQQIKEITQGLKEEAVSNKEAGSTEEATTTEEPSTPSADSYAAMAQVMGQLSESVGYVETVLTQSEAFQADINSRLCNDLIADAQNSLDHLVKELKKSHKKEKKAKKENKWMGIATKVVAATLTVVAIITCQPELLILAVALYFSSEIDKSITDPISTGLQKAGMSENHAHMLAEGITIAAVAVATMGVGGAATLAGTAGEAAADAAASGAAEGTSTVAADSATTATTDSAASTASSTSSRMGAGFVLGATSQLGSSDLAFKLGQYIQEKVGGSKQGWEYAMEALMLVTCLGAGCRASLILPGAAASSTSSKATEAVSETAEATNKVSTATNIATKVPELASNLSKMYTDSMQFLMKTPLMYVLAGVSVAGSAVEVGLDIDLGFVMRSIASETRHASKSEANISLDSELQNMINDLTSQITQTYTNAISSIGSTLNTALQNVIGDASAVTSLMA